MRIMSLTVLKEMDCPRAALFLERRLASIHGVEVLQWNPACAETCFDLIAFPF